MVLTPLLQEVRGVEFRQAREGGQTCDPFGLLAGKTHMAYLTVATRTQRLASWLAQNCDSQKQKGMV